MLSLLAYCAIHFVAFVFLVIAFFSIRLWRGDDDRRTANRYDQLRATITRPLSILSVLLFLREVSEGAHRRYLQFTQGLAVVALASWCGATTLVRCYGASPETIAATALLNTVLVALFLFATSSTGGAIADGFGDYNNCSISNVELQGDSSVDFERLTCISNRQERDDEVSGPSSILARSRACTASGLCAEHTVLAALRIRRRGRENGTYYNNYTGSSSSPSDSTSIAELIRDYFEDRTAGSGGVASVHVVPVPEEEVESALENGVGGLADSQNSQLTAFDYPITGCDTGSGDLAVVAFVSFFDRATAARVLLQDSPGVHSRTKDRVADRAHNEAAPEDLDGVGNTRDHDGQVRVHVSHVIPAPVPDDIVWENIHVSSRTGRFRLAVSLFVLLFLFCLVATPRVFGSAVEAVVAFLRTSAVGKQMLGEDDYTSRTTARVERQQRSGDPQTASVAQDQQSSADYLRSDDQGNGPTQSQGTSTGTYRTTIPSSAHEIFAFLWDGACAAAPFCLLNFVNFTVLPQAMWALAAHAQRPFSRETRERSVLLLHFLAYLVLFGLFPVTGAQSFRDLLDGSHIEIKKEEQHFEGVHQFLLRYLITATFVTPLVQVVLRPPASDVQDTCEGSCFPDRGRQCDRDSRRCSSSLSGRFSALLLTTRERFFHALERKACRHEPKPSAVVSDEFEAGTNYQYAGGGAAGSSISFAATGSCVYNENGGPLFSAAFPSAKMAKKDDAADLVESEEFEGGRNYAHTLAVTTLTLALSASQPGLLLLAGLHLVSHFLAEKYLVVFHVSRFVQFDGARLEKLARFLLAMVALPLALLLQMWLFCEQTELTTSSANEWSSRDHSPSRYSLWWLGVGAVWFLLVAAAERRSSAGVNFLSTGRGATNIFVSSTIGKLFCTPILSVMRVVSHGCRACFDETTASSTEEGFGQSCNRGQHRLMYQGIKAEPFQIEEEKELNAVVVDNSSSALHDDTLSTTAGTLSHTWSSRSVYQRSELASGEFLLALVEAYRPPLLPSLLEGEGDSRSTSTHNKWSYTAASRMRLPSSYPGGSGESGSSSTWGSWRSSSSSVFSGGARDSAAARATEVTTRLSSCRPSSASSTAATFVGDARLSSSSNARLSSSTNARMSATSSYNMAARSSRMSVLSEARRSTSVFERPSFLKFDDPASRITASSSSRVSTQDAGRSSGAMGGRSSAIRTAGRGSELGGRSSSASVGGRISGIGERASGIGLFPSVSSLLSRGWGNERRSSSGHSYAPIRSTSTVSRISETRSVSTNAPIMPLLAEENTGPLTDDSRI
ncbi:unnamed protein product [Amoebophrya sp. A25]|nr:unnamed protein product [Amoebophrya sp. A25]|eukprot:GSA25T00004921001.1